MTLSTSEENYLKAIYSLTKNDGDSASTNDIAKKLNTRASSVTDMTKKLSEKGFTVYQKYKGTKLTDSGFSAAVRVIRKHRLWEVFLVDKLDFKWDEVHEIAEQLEHIQSVELTKRLDRFLGNPTVDPHGDPIPNENGELKTIDSVSLSEINVNEKACIVGVVHSDASFLQYLEKNALILGVEVLVQEHFDFDGSVKIKTVNEEVNLSEKVAKNIRVIKIID